MHIGLIGGIGPAATDYYYRGLIAAYAARDAAPDLTMVHADNRTLIANLAANATDAQAAVYAGLAARLKVAGAGCVVIPSVGGHFCIDAFAPISPLPVINIIDAVSAFVETSGYERIGVLGTRTVMETGVYGKITRAQMLKPSGDLLDAVHQAYVEMAASGMVTAEQRVIFDRATRQMIDEQGADAILLGGTDLALVYSEQTAPFPIVDCAAIHIDAILARAFGT